jgi:hypothetical protein
VANSTTVRITGAVLAVDSRSGVSTRGPEPRPYTIRTARVLVGEHGIAEVNLPDSMPLPVRGEVVDLLAEVSEYGGNLRTRAVSEFPALVGA